jgi:uncharacterized protein (DUF433 family)
MGKTKRVKETQVTYSTRPRRTKGAPRSNGARLTSSRRVPDTIPARRRILGQYILSDPAVHNGKPIFIGTRIPVEQVIEQIANGVSRNKIVKASEGKVSRNAIAEALLLAAKTFRDHAREYSLSERDARDLEIINRNAKQLNREALDVLEYQVIP